MNTFVLAADFQATKSYLFIKEKITLCYLSRLQTTSHYGNCQPVLTESRPQ